MALTYQHTSQCISPHAAAQKSQPCIQHQFDAVEQSDREAGKRRLQVEPEPWDLESTAWLCKAAEACSAALGTCSSEGQ